jgi:hypothetical protein
VTPLCNTYFSLSCADCGVHVVSITWSAYCVAAQSGETQISIPGIYFCGQRRQTDTCRLYTCRLKLFSQEEIDVARLILSLGRQTRTCSAGSTYADYNCFDKNKNVWSNTDIGFMVAGIEPATSARVCHAGAWRHAAPWRGARAAAAP